LDSREASQFLDANVKQKVFNRTFSKEHLFEVLWNPAPRLNQISVTPSPRIDFR
jgi:hypothetical protein